MDDLSRKFRSIDWKGLQKSARKVQASTASALKDMVMTDLENKTRAATADTTWGASGADLMAIAQGTYRREDYALIMSIVWQRLASSRWRCVYKALEVLKFLIMHGAGRCAEEARTAQPHLYALKDYVAKDDHGRDVADGVRARATLVCDMLADANVLDAERAHSRELRAKLAGGSGTAASLSSDDYRLSSARARSGSYGTADQQPGWNPPGSPANRTTTATFKGYGDDDDDDHDGGNGTAAAMGRYDDDAAPAGQLALRASAAAAVDDLLGDGPDSGSDDDSDHEAHARGTGAAGGKPASETAGLDDLFAGLGVSDTPAAAAQCGGTGSLTTSQIVLQLARANEQAGSQLAVVEQASGVDGMSDNVSGVQMVSSVSGGGGGGGGVSAGGLAAVRHAGVANSGTDLFRQDDGKETGVGNRPKKVLSRVGEKEKDPFADLVATGKNSGVL